MNKYTIEEEKKIAKEYIDGKSSYELCKIYGYKTHKSITDKVKKYYGKEYVRSSEESINIIKNRNDLLQFRLNEIDSEFKAYFLGLMTSDGCIHSNNKSIELSMTDEDVIKFCSLHIGKNYKSYIREGNRKKIHRITFNHKELVEDLKRYNIIPQKTHIIKGFSFNPSEEKYIPYYVRGCIDGDGWIRKDGHEFYICSASYEYIIWLKKLLETKIYMVDLNVYQDENGVYYIRSSLEKNINILKAIIYDKPFGMSRKYNKLHQIKQTNCLLHD